MNILQIRPLHDEHNGTKICNDANSRATVRKRIHRIYLAAPLDAHAWAEVHTGLPSRLSPHLVDLLHRDVVAVHPRAERPQWETCYALHDCLQSLSVP